MELYIYGILHLTFSDRSWPWVTETVKIEAVDKGDWDRSNFIIVSLHIQMCLMEGGFPISGTWWKPEQIHDTYLYF